MTAVYCIHCVMYISSVFVYSVHQCMCAGVRVCVHLCVDTDTVGTVQSVYIYNIINVFNVSEPTVQRLRASSRLYSVDYTRPVPTFKSVFLWNI
jgi:hypothetical protein